MRWTGALWFAPLCFAFAALVSSSEAGIDDGYTLGAVASGMFAIAFVGPLQGAFVAWRFHSFAARLGPLRPLRPIGAWMTAWWPLVFGVPAAATIGVMAGTGAFPTDLRTAVVLALGFLTVFGCGLFGLTVSRFVPVALAVPITAAVTFAWLALPSAGDNLLLRHLNASYPACCTQQQIPVATSIYGSYLFAGVLAAVLLLGLVLPRWWRISQAWIGALLVVAVVTAGGAGYVYVDSADEELTYTAVSDRPRDELQCEIDSGLKVCLWPEDEPQRRAATAAAREVNRGLRTLGASTFDIATTAVAAEGEMSFTGSQRFTSSDLRYSIASGAVSALRACAGRDPGAFAPDAVGYLLLASGASRADLNATLDPSVLAKLRNAPPPSSQRSSAWFAGALGASPTCSE